jgi:rhodanese-related sulfurtransferase
MIAGAGTLGSLSPASPFLLNNKSFQHQRNPAMPVEERTSTTRRFLSLPTGKPVNIQHIGREAMEEILEDLEDGGGREESMYVVIDVRRPDEIAYTGKLSPSVHSIPVEVIAAQNVFEMDPETFQEEFGFDKPTPDETLVFTCAAGIRSVSACNLAARAGYTKLVNYMGGANEWFSPS